MTHLLEEVRHITEEINNNSNNSVYYPRFVVDIEFELQDDLSDLKQKNAELKSENWLHKAELKENFCEYECKCIRI